MALAPDGRTIYIANRDNRTLGIIPVAGGGSNVVRPSVGPVEVAITRDGRTVYTAGCKGVLHAGLRQHFRHRNAALRRRDRGRAATRSASYSRPTTASPTSPISPGRASPSSTWRPGSVDADVPACRCSPPGSPSAPGGDTLYVASQTEGFSHGAGRRQRRDARTARGAARTRRGGARRTAASSTSRPTRTCSSWTPRRWSRRSS